MELYIDSIDIFVILFYEGSIDICYSIFYEGSIDIFCYSILSGHFGHGPPNRHTILSVDWSGSVRGH